MKVICIKEIIGKRISCIQEPIDYLKESHIFKTVLKNPLSLATETVNAVQRGLDGPEASGSHGA